MKSIDIAYHLLKKSIKLGQEEPKYYMDFIKLHKLMFLAQCYLNYEYGLNLFDECITANEDGPFVNGINAIPAICGFGEIKTIDELNSYLNDMMPFHINHRLPLPALRDETCDLILDMYGKYNTLEIVKLSKNTIAYNYSYSENSRNVITKALLTKTGEEIYNMHKQEKNVSVLTKKLTPSNNK